MKVGKMADLQRRTIGPYLNRVTMIVAITFLLVPQGAFSENIKLFPVVATGNPEARHEAKQDEKAKGKHLALGADDDGNVMIRYGRLSLTMIYGPDESASELRERAGLVPPIKESIGLGEVSCKLGFTF
ncbi:hypothetical protein [Geotalea uraniireducens]|uniref:hypothetical protein n=1 Tax=Geotalea uraniireducens TaxID=351604 RepID=UPI00059E0F40|nr:hypothetical protein [Geotalea uraniireducens]